MDLNETWKAVLGELELTLSKASFTTWFKGARLLKIEEDDAIIGVPTIFSKEWFEKKYHPQILKTLKKLTGNKVKKISYKVGSLDEPENLKNTPKNKPSRSKKTVIDSYLDSIDKAPKKQLGWKIRPDYTFDNFVVGSTNRLAYAASQAIANNPGSSHNPLVIYGGVGLGKTHLIHAIGNTIKKKHPQLNILFTSCEDFANEFVSSIQTKKTDSFKKKYRSIDVFLVDDIQFLSRKEGTQEEFFHTFNTLYQNNRQIVMTSDRLPTAIPDLEDRLSSRFSWGMIADIQPPDLETRQAILRKKADICKIEVGQEILDLIAESCSNNIRELEGALNRLRVYSELNNAPITVELTKEALKEFLNTNFTKGSPNSIINIVSDYFTVPVSDLIGKIRRKDIVFPRHIIMYLLRNELTLSYPKIGDLLGGRDHTTVIHGVSMVERELAKNEDLRRQIAELRAKIYSK